MNDHELNWGVIERQQPSSTHTRRPTGPVRTCVGCRQRALIRELLRMVARDGHLVVDQRRRLPGRGAWLHPKLGCLSVAERRRAFPRALRVSGSLDVARVRHHLERHV